MADSKSGKGNPAHKRMSNAALKARRARCWANGQKRKEERRRQQAEAEKRNKALRAEGKLTPWEERKQARRLKRAADPLVQQRALEWEQKRLREDATRAAHIEDLKRQTRVEAGEDKLKRASVALAKLLNTNPV